MKIGIDFGKTGEQFVENFAARPVKAIAKSTRQWAGELAKDRNPFFFSAKCSDAKLLEAMKHYIERDLAGDPAHGRARFVKTMRRLQGVPIDAGDSRRMTDLRSSRRLKLIYDFHAARVRAEEKTASVDNDDHRIAFPYRELYRPGSSHPKAPRDWISRCEAAGFSIVGGRIFAPRDSVLWRTINRFGFDHEPFDFNSGMETRYVSRAEARRLDLDLVSLDEAIENPRAVTREQARAEQDRKRYMDASAPADEDARRAALEEFDRPGKPFTLDEARTLPTNKYIPPEAFEGTDAQNKYLGRKWNNFAENMMPESMPPRDSAVVKRYTTNSSGINKAYRDDDRAAPEDVRDAKELRKIMKEFRTKIDVETVRTASVDEVKNFLGIDFAGDVDAQLLDLESSLDKRIFRGVMSTSSFAKFHPKGLAQRDGVAVEYRVAIPRGSHAMFFDPISTKGPYGPSGGVGARKAPPRLWSEDGKNTESEIAIAPDSVFCVKRHEWRIENGLRKLLIFLTLASV